jgi:catechol 2,3-dioxygenase-like lactoylglutathione lyase family enzyme
MTKRFAIIGALAKPAEAMHHDGPVRHRPGTRSGLARDEAMITIREIDHVVLRVVELPTMVDFYCRVLGCAVERRRDALGLVQLRAGRSLIDLVTVAGELGATGGAAPGDAGRNMDHFCLRIDPFDAVAIRAFLARHGVVAGEVASRFGAEGEGPSLYVSDPEGNTVELKGPPAAAASD